MQTLHDPQLFRQHCLINGQWQASQNNETLAVHNPATGDTLGHVPKLSVHDIEQAIQAAKHAWPAWRAQTAKQRAQLLMRWYQLILDNTEDIAKIMTLEQGKPLQEARKEVEYAASFVEWFAEEAKRIYGDVIPAPIKNHHILVIKQPVGVVSAITPWNFPAAMITRKCAPALAAGCPIVLKPSSLTPFTALALAELAQRAGIPAGVINVVTGDASMIGTMLATHPDIRKISFTGSTEIGKLLMQQASGTIKKVSLELGGNAPFIIFDDADIDAAVNGLMASKFRNMGQTCVCANRILVQENIYDLFLEKFTAAVKKLRVGNGLQENIDQGPLINEAGAKKVEALIAEACKKGAKIICGGKRPALGSTFFEPTILSNATPQMRLANEEIFGPVAALFKFKTEEEAIQFSNATPFGLASYFYSENIHRIWRVSEQLEYGIVGVNSGIISSEVAPFGGVKESGIGREGSKYGIEQFVEIKHVYMG